MKKKIDFEKFNKKLKLNKTDRVEETVFNLCRTEDEDVGSTFFTRCHFFANVVTVEIQVMIRPFKILKIKNLFKFFHLKFELKMGIFYLFLLLRVFDGIIEETSRVEDAVATLPRS